MKFNIKVLSLFLLLFLGVDINAQVFKVTPSSTTGQKKTKLKHRFSTIDTVFMDWQFEKGQEIDTEKGIKWLKVKDEQGFGFFASAGETIGLMSVKYRYTKGKVSGCTLYFDVFNAVGNELASTTIDHDKGITTVGITSDGTNFFLAYSKAINSGDRDLYVSKISAEAKLVWETKVGKRFGTSGPGLIKINADKQVVLFTQMYDKVSFDILSPEGKIVDRKFVPFVNEFSPASFTFNKAGHIVAIGSSRRYVNSKTISSIIIFELDESYQPLRYREFGSSYTDLGTDVIPNDEGGYYFLGNCENFKAPYGQRPNFTVIGKLDEELKPKRIKRMLNNSTGLNLTMAWSPQNGLIFFQRSGERGYGFHLFQLDADLELYKIHNVKGIFLNPNNLIVGNDNNLILGGGSSKSWLVGIQLK
jgi:hypothetical protein